MDFETERQKVGEGWQPLLEKVHGALSTLAPGYEITQIKEKFGGLRYYYALPKDTREKTRQACRKIVDSAESESFYICEQCGQPGGTKSYRGWLVTLCEDHHAEREIEVEQRYQNLEKGLGGDSE